MPTGEQYASLYHLLVCAIDDALTELEHQHPYNAQNRLKAALLECEQMYLDYTEQEE